MKKFIAILPIAILFILLSYNYNVSAVTAEKFGYVTYKHLTTGWHAYVYAYKFDHFSNTSDNQFYYCTASIAIGTFNSEEAALSSILDWISIHSPSEYNPTSANGLPMSYSVLVSNIKIYNVPYQFLPSGAEDMTPAIEDPNYWQEMWDTLREELGNPAFWFGEWFINIIDGVFGNDEQDPTGPPKPPLSTHVTINNPTITPAPTPIPYSTIIVPKTDPVSGDTYYEENYYYINPSGTPIITSSPPTNTPSSNGSGNGTDYSPVDGDPYSIPQVSWLTNATIGENDYNGILSISQGMDSIDAIGSDYTDGMGAVQDATGTLPTSWLLLIGIAAAIPLIAGIISRFLS